MSDERSTNHKIADLIKEQTYDERMELAEWLITALDDVDTPTKDWMAGLLGDWADAFIEEVE